MTSYTPRKRGGSRHGGHVVVTGDVSYDSVSSFLHEFYGPRQGLVDMDVVVLADEQPSRHLAALLRQAQYQRRVSYLFGSLLHEKDAARARVDSATAVFVLATAQPTRHASTADASTILHAIAVDRVTLHARQRSDAMRCFIQLLAPRPPRCLRQITGVEVALNTPRVRAAILARNVVCPGATALVLNLLSSAKESELAAAATAPLWITEYSHGLQHQFFPVILPRAFDGVLWDDAVEWLYTKCVHFVSTYCSVLMEVWTMDLLYVCTTALK
ncbi:hypothetical protein PINS_up018180 [Pythium insidiosum]|nr:hypothetical protein PINS_up018180 [Pythium insidiosum]